MSRAKWWASVLALALVLGMCVATLSEPALAAAEPERGNPDVVVAAALQSLAEQAKDPWEKAIYEASAKEATQDGSSVRFLLRSFNLDPKSMPDYAEDPQAWRDEFFARVSAYGLEASLVIAGDAPDSASIRKLKGVVTKAAMAAKTAFGQKTVRTALMDLLFEGDGSGALAPLLAAQSKQSLSAKNGPHELALTWTGANPSSLIEDAYKSVLEQLSKVHKANAMDESDIGARFADALAKKAASIRKQGGKAYAFTLDIDKLSTGDFGVAFEEYVRLFDPAFALSQLIYEVRAMPDAPPQPFPQSGRINGGKSGTKVTIKGPDDDVGRYVQMRNSETDGIAADMFIRSGGSVTVYVPQGMYYLLIASGERWYGMEELFGSGGNYSKTAETEVLSKDYYHTITLESSSGGNMLVYESNPDAFK